MYAEGGVLVGHDVVLVLRVDGLVVRRDVDVVGREAVPAEGLEEVGVPGPVEVEGGEVGVFVLWGGGLDMAPVRILFLENVVVVVVVVGGGDCGK